jgi:RND family efflux transporter MFP subunit
MRDKLKQVVFFLLASTFFVIALWVLEQPIEEVVLAQKSAAFIPKVSYTNALASTQQSEVSAFGELKPKWDVMIKAQVNGPITFIDPIFESGSLVTAQSILMRMDDTAYKSEKITAEVALAEAKLQRLQAHNKTQLAKQNWKRLGIKSAPSDLTLFKPQLKIAEKALVSARQRLSVATQNLSYTQVRVPFEGIIIERMVGLGQHVTEGETLLRLIDHQNLLLSVSFSETQWENISDNWLNSQAKLYSSTGDAIGTATIVRGGHHLNSETRQYPLFMEVNSANNNLLVSGQFVQVKVAGKNLTHYLRLPESTLTREGIIWIIDQQDTLRAYHPKDIHYQNKQVLVPAPKLFEDSVQNSWRIATTPLGSFISGKHVQPIEYTGEK